MAYDFNPETQSDRYAEERRIALSASGKTFETTIRLPLYMRDVLKSEHWDRVIADVKARFEIYVSNALGLIKCSRERSWLEVDEAEQWRTVEKLTSKYTCERIYEIFSDCQLRAGNDAWEVPHSLQAHSVH